MVDTAGTLTLAAAALKKHGARQVHAYSVHPVLSGPAVKRIKESPFEKMVVSDTIPLSPEAQNSGVIEVLSTARIFGEAIRRIHSGESLSTLFVWP
jgi:ribose-phosphate pyrophosphokinase